MDRDIKAFRAAAARENGTRTGLQRRYSPTVRADAVQCWRVRQGAGEGLREVAAALGIAPWSLHRWTRAAPTATRFHPVQIVSPEPPAEPASLVIVVSAGQTRVEGLDVASAARLLTLLR
jgi:transposase-like protein